MGQCLHYVRLENRLSLLVIHYSPLTIDQQYMHRCIELARFGAGYTAPNPMVGAVLVYEDRIIGEGWHQKYGEAHAEVNCIHRAIQNDQTGILHQSTLYVSLEPCAHHGKTPPCTDLIIQHKIARVIIGCRDPFKEVDGKGIEKLKAAGVEVELGVLEKECKELNEGFFTYHTEHRPYVILKWAETGDGFISTSPQTPLQRRGAYEDSDIKRLMISNEYSNRLVHKWRSEEAAILIGTNTAILDDPELTARLWPGPSPIRLVVDMDLKLPSSLKIFNDASPTIIFNTKVHSKESEWPVPSPKERVASPAARLRRPMGVRSLYYQITNDVSLVHQILHALYQLKIQTVIVEGGARLLKSFMDEGMWDEARIIKNDKLIINNGLNAPTLENAEKIDEYRIASDAVEIYKLKSSRLPTHVS